MQKKLTHPMSPQRQNRQSDRGGRQDSHRSTLEQRLYGGVVLSGVELGVGALSVGECADPVESAGRPDEQRQVSKVS
jgi:hypothetical protein